MADPDAARLHWIEHQADVHDPGQQPDTEHDQLDWEER